MNDKKVYSRLEFSEDWQKFHLTNGNTYGENTHGWRTVCKRDEDRYLSKFIDFMEWRYNFSKKKPIKLNTVLKQFETYKWIVESTKRF